MKIIVFVMMLLSLLNASVEELSDPYANVQYYQLDNGLNVYLLSDDKAESTKITMKVNVGSSVEDETTLGLTHLVEHLVFRDQRVPHRDYLDYIKEEGGTYVNGYTKRYETSYLTTIDSSKSYWIAEIFAQMIFDKNVTTLDLETEKGALQTEVGKYKFIEMLFWRIAKAFKTVSPKREELYRDEFGLEPVPELPPRYLAKKNNAQFSLEQVMQHYNSYYYPSNMKLMIVGKFDVEKMKQLIETKYGKYHKEGVKRTVKPLENPELNHKPYRRFYEGTNKNSGFIGAKYTLLDYKRYLVLDAYTANVALRIQQHLRNKLGHTYSVNPYMFNERKAGVASVAFDGLHDEFEANLAYVQETIAKDAEFLDDETIDAALKAYETKAYAYKEHDSDSLMKLVNVVEYLRVEQNITDRTAYDIFNSITHDEFRNIITTVFRPENSYVVIYRDHYFFPYDIVIFSFFIMILLALVYFKINRIDYYLKGLTYTKRDVCFDRRLSNRFLGFLKFLFIFLLSSILWEWIKYMLSLLIMDDPYYLHTVDVPYSYLVTVGDSLISIVIFVVVYRYLFNYYARMDVSKETIYLVGNRITVIPKEMINKIDVVSWSAGKFTKIRGLVLFFWRPLVKVEMKDGKVFYLRTSAAEHLKEDIEKCLEM